MATLHGLSSIDAVRQFRKNYINFHALWRLSGVPEGSELKIPADHPIGALEMQPALKDSVAAYQQAHPHSRLTLEKFLRYHNGRLVLVVEDETPLPDERQLVTFSHTSTILSLEGAEVLTELVVARRHDAPASRNNA